MSSEGHDMDKLDISHFKNAIARLQEGLVDYASYPLILTVRDGLIQRFEFTYEISHKTLKRYMEFTSATPEQYDGMAFQDLIRSGNEQGLLLGEWVDWKSYRDMRSKTSHTYDEETALEVVAKIPTFLREAQHLYEQLQRKLA